MDRINLEAQLAGTLGFRLHRNERGSGRKVGRLTRLRHLFIGKHQEGLAIPQSITGSLNRPPKSFALRLKRNHGKKPAEKGSHWTPQESPVQKAMHLSIESGN